jgi:hypothetical protein
MLQQQMVGQILYTFCWKMKQILRLQMMMDGNQSMQQQPGDTLV